MVEKNSGAPLREITTLLPGVSTHTEPSCRTTYAAASPWAHYLNARKMKFRFEWAKARKYWEIQWKKRIFCDETTVVTGGVDIRNAYGGLMASI